jgi:phosphatidylserine decarboxylase
MNVFNCHVNRVPISGKIDEIFYKPGKFIDASLDKASEDNERNLIKYSNGSGKTFAIVQIAGLIARRIICEVKQGQNLNQGDRIGIIRFGSRVDLYFDNDYKLLAKQGQTVVAGESLLAKI